MSFPRYPSYKPSGVEWLGEVPEHWAIQSLKHIAKLQTGTTPPTEDQDNFSNECGYQWIRPEDIDETGKASKSSKFLSEQGWERVRRIRAGASLICCIGSIGKVGYVADVVSTNQQITAAEPLDDARYLFHSIRAARSELDLSSSGNVLRILNTERLGAVRFARPPLPEQAAIATFLDHETVKIDALIAEQQRLIELLQEKRQAVISHAVTKGLNPNAPMKDSGVEWLGEVPEHWEILELKHLKKEGTSITYGIVQAGPHIEDGIPYIRTSDMASDRLMLATCQRTSLEIDESYARSRVVEGDLVVAIRATVGKVLEVPVELDGANLTQGTAKFSPGPRVYAKFVKSSFEANYCQSQIMSFAKGATFLEITLDVLRRIKLAIPPLTEQKEIVLYLAEATAQLGDLLGAAELTIFLLQERRSALISAAVTGQIDVRGLVPEDETA